MKRVYLCGAINGCTDAECKDWREQAKALLGEGYECVDPMRRDYRGRELANSPQIVHCDKRDIDQCNVVLAKVDTPSWGTAMEVFYAFGQLSKLVVAFHGLESHPSPWLRMHTHCLVPKLEEAVEFIRLGEELPPPCPKCGFSRCTAGQYVCQPKA